MISYVKPDIQNYSESYFHAGYRSCQHQKRPRFQFSTKIKIVVWIWLIAPTRHKLEKEIGQSSTIGTKAIYIQLFARIVECMERPSILNRAIHEISFMVINHHMSKATKSTRYCWSYAKSVESDNFCGRWLLIMKSGPLTTTSNENGRSRIAMSQRK